MEARANRQPIAQYTNEAGDVYVTVQALDFRLIIDTHVIEGDNHDWLRSIADAINCAFDDYQQQKETSDGRERAKPARVP
jgi:hypothetical protein